MIDLSGQDFALNPAPHYAELRARCPVSWQRISKSWLATRYDDVFEILRDPRMPHVGILGPWLRLRDKHGWDFSTSIRVISSMPFNYEGEVHAALRRSFAKSLAPFAERSERFATRARRILDQAKRDGGFDFSADFSNRLMFEAICDLAEIGETDREVLYPLSRLSWTIEATLTMRERQAMDQTLKQAFDLLAEEVPRLIARSPDSLLSSIYRELPDDEPDKVSVTIAMLCVMLLMGNDALGGALSYGVRWLLDESMNGGETVAQADWGRVSDDLLRHNATVDFLTRVALDGMTIGDVTVAPGDWIMASTLSANRDPAKFGPDADKISFRNNHGVGLTFGTGRHLCLGMQISRKLAQASLGVLAEMPPLRITGSPVAARGRIVRTLESLPVSLD